MPKERTADDFNSMTISWGGMGTIWNQPAAFLFVKSVRYTYEFVSRHEEITVSFYDEKYRRALAIFGSRSGRDTDKPHLAGLTPGVKCSSIGKPEDHRGCLCNKAIDTKETVAVTYEGPLGKAYGYWIPISEKPEWIIHFGVGRFPVYEEIKR